MTARRCLRLRRVTNHAIYRGSGADPTDGECGLVHTGADASMLETLRIGKLVKDQRHHQLRRCRAQRTRAGAGTTMMNGRGTASKDPTKRQLAVDERNVDLPIDVD